MIPATSRRTRIWTYSTYRRFLDRGCELPNDPRIIMVVDQNNADLVPLNWSVVLRSRPAGKTLDTIAWCQGSTGGKADFAFLAVEPRGGGAPVDFRFYSKISAQQFADIFGGTLMEAPWLDPAAAA